MNNLLWHLTQSLPFADKLLDNAWGKGDLSTIPFVKNGVTLVTVIVISIIGLGIVSSSIICACINGLVATFPKFWDKVDEAHREAENSWSNIRGKNGDTTWIKRARGIGSMLLAAVPNMKAMSNFAVDADGNAPAIDRKAFFMVAIPTTVGAIFIGYFIYYGYPLKIGEKFSVGVSATIDTVLDNMDPKGLVENVGDKLGLKLTMPDFVTKGSTEPYSKNVYEMSKDLYTTYVGHFTDIQKANRKALGLNIEQWVSDVTNEFQGYFDPGNYSVSFDTSLVRSDPSKQVDAMHNKPHSDGSTTLRFAQRADAWETGTTMSTDNVWIVLAITCKPVASKEVGNTINCTMQCPVMIAEGSKQGKVIANGNGKFVTTAGGAFWGTSNLINEITISEDGKTLTFENMTSPSGTIKVEKLYYEFGATKCKVTSITLGGTNGIVFTGENNKMWNFGDDPTTAGGNSSNAGEINGDTSNSDGQGAGI